MGSFWSDAELVTTVYFCSRGFTDGAVSRILSIRGYYRTPFLQLASGSWDIDEVDMWLDSLSLDHETVNHLIACNRINAYIADEHGILAFVLQNLTSQSQRWGWVVST
ncbi:hypothetical protein BDV35DRAFT_402635 [Aspergillus flavus]|uniref:Uncharacterized protein n=1 Tax=Aspergillus flavus TaxID=5059 RepID=A0A5N6GDR4_ASPFL|nr:hypothetical protein BDV35DRAFT_402635 [Aspergillus flavus]